MREYSRSLRRGSNCLAPSLSGLFGCEVLIIPTKLNGEPVTKKVKTSVSPYCPENTVLRGMVSAAE
jgi:hypothetical protein